jgi:hypothetical protein
MKYPNYTISQPVVGSAAKRIVTAVKGGKTISNVHVKATATRIAKRHVKASK